MSTVLAQKLWCTLWSAGSLGRFAQHMSNAAHQVSCIGSEEQRVYEEPHVIFQNWLMAAQKEAPQVRPRLACMATVDKSGEPVTRLTSIEEVNSHGITFFTTLGSRQAGEISANPHVSLHFNWAPLMRSPAESSSTVGGRGVTRSIRRCLSGVGVLRTGCWV